MSVFGLRGLRALIVCGLMLLPLVAAHATPIEPDLREILDNAQKLPPKYIPARAGWYGPESAKRPQLPLNPQLEALKPENLLARQRAAIVATAIPDWRVLLLLAGVIVLLRRVRSEQQDFSQRPRKQTLAFPSPVERPEAPGERPRAA